MRLNGERLEDLLSGDLMVRAVAAGEYKLSCKLASRGSREKELTVSIAAGETVNVEVSFGALAGTPSFKLERKPS